MKRFKYFTDLVPTVQAPFLLKDLNIVCAMHSCFFARLSSDSDDLEVATRVLEELNAPNIIQSIVEKVQLIRRNFSFEPISADHFQHLPAWTTEDLLSFSGAYQFSIAKSYIGDQIIGDPTTD